MLFEAYGEAVVGFNGLGRGRKSFAKHDATEIVATAMAAKIAVTAEDQRLTQDKADEGFGELSAGGGIAGLCEACAVGALEMDFGVLVFIYWCARWFSCQISGPGWPDYCAAGLRTTVWVVPPVSASLPKRDHIITDGVAVNGKGVKPPEAYGGFTKWPKLRNDGR